MNKRYLCVLLSVFTFLVFGQFSANAETSIAVVDVQKILTEADAAQSIQNQIKLQRETFLEQLSVEEHELREHEKKLVEEGKSLEKEEFAKKRKAFEEKFLEARRDAQKKKSSLDEAFTKAMSQLREELYQAVKSIADERGYSLVISNQSVVLGEKSIDITDEAMKRLNESVSDIALRIESN